MGDSFFGFETDLPPLGGKSSMMGNDLMEAPEEEEEFDLMNDETFGDVDAGGDWEQEHENLLESEHFHRDANSTRDSGFNSGERKFSRGHASSIQESLEQSLSQLVVEDDDDLADPAIMNVSKSRPIPVKQQSLDELFGPSSPPGFLNTEHLVSPGRQNIWGSPVKESFMPKKENGLQTLLHALQTSKPKHYQDAHQLQKTVPGVHKPMSSSLPSPHELTGSAMSSLHGHMHQAPDNMNGMGDAKPRALTVEELERELRSEAPLPASHMRMPPHMVPPGGNNNLPLPIGTPPRSHMMHQAQKTVERAEVTPTHPHPVNRVSPPLGPFGMHRVSPPLGMPHQQFQQIGRSPKANMYSSPIPGRGKDRPYYNTPDNHRMPPYSDPTHHRGRGNGPFNQGRGRGQWNNRGEYHGRRDYPNHGDHHNRGDFHRNNDYHNHGDRSFQHREYRERWDRDRPPHPRGDYYQGQYRDGDGQYHQRDYHQGAHRDRDAADGDDDFAYLMTQREKDWIIKIQLMQLQTDNPYLDDFYYTTYTMKKLAVQQQNRDGVQRESDNSDSKLVLPQLAKIETRNYKPAQFEGSLGKLTTSSVHNPRQIIDKVTPSTGAEDEKGPAKDFRKFKKLLLDIEKMYGLLLDIDDTEKKILALPEDARKPLLCERQNLTCDLYQRLSCEDESSDTLLCIMSIRKGKKLVARALPLFDQRQGFEVVSWLFLHLLTIEKRDQNDHSLPHVYRPVSSVVKACDLADLVTFSSRLTIGLGQMGADLKAVFCYQFGCSLLVQLLCRGEAIFTCTSPVDMDLQAEQLWTQFVTAVAEALVSCEDTVLASPLEKDPRLAAHMERLLSSDLFLQAEDKIKRLTQH